MLRREDHYMIKQRHQQGAFIVDIAHQIGCSEKTVRRHISYPAPPTAKRGKKQVAKLEPFKDYIDSRLSEQVWNAAVIFEEIREKGYRGGSAMLRRYIHPKRPLRASKNTVRFETLPGYQLQHDWGEIIVEVAGSACTVNFAVNTLGFSRRFHVFAAPKQDAEHTYESLVRSFNYFGGSVKNVLVDNQKAAVIKHGQNGHIEFNAGFLQLANHYGFSPRACKPYRPQTKGKTERMVGYVKHNFFTRYRQFESFAHVNQLLAMWLAKVADQRHLRQFKQTPENRFAEEKIALMPLPATDFDTSYFDLRQVAWDSYIDVRGNRYSVPSFWCGRAVNIRIGLDNTLRIYGDEQLLATHLLQEVTQGWQKVPEHHQALWQQVNRVASRSLSVYEELL
ncbi:IS21 family transposase [Candidatus Regiella endosymbiont of Tuberolachnus salignus]|uniref:IS21 family transposase n=1 Tax=Candidatus Regiella endosymbiont of Tuberolachnus salignus TaxID=3077956 RepID=UPI0030CD82CB